MGDMMGANGAEDTQAHDLIRCGHGVELGACWECDMDHPLNKQIAESMMDANRAAEIADEILARARLVDEQSNLLTIRNYATELAMRYKDLERRLEVAEIRVGFFDEAAKCAAENAALRDDVRKLSGEVEAMTEVVRVARLVTQFCSDEVGDLILVLINEIEKLDGLDKRDEGK